MYNYTKSSVLICRNKSMDHAAPPVFTVNGSIIGESDKVSIEGILECVTVAIQVNKPISKKFVISCIYR